MPIFTVRFGNGVGKKAIPGQVQRECAKIFEKVFARGWGSGKVGGVEGVDLQ